jgi:hypothetical protein
MQQVGHLHTLPCWTAVLRNAVNVHSSEKVEGAAWQQEEPAEVFTIRMGKRGSLNCRCGTERMGSKGSAGPQNAQDSAGGSRQGKRMNGGIHGGGVLCTLLVGRAGKREYIRLSKGNIGDEQADCL